MKTIVLQLPSKTFFAGEYLALEGGPALVMATQPRFEMRITEAANSTNPFHSQSPAGKLWIRYQSFFQNYRYEFTDPHAGRGGFGGSTAEFAFLHVFHQMRESAWTEAQLNFDLHLVWKEYRELATTRLSTPSGADLLTQLQGGFTFFERETNRIQKFSWPFMDLGFALVRTSQKLTTHTHLDQKPVFQSHPARQALDLMQAALTQIDSQMFIQALKLFASELEKAELVAPWTRHILKKLSLEPRVLVAKGCGALGADVVLAVYALENKQPVLDILSSQNLELVATEASICLGLSKKIESLSASADRAEALT